MSERKFQKAKKIISRSFVGLSREDPLVAKESNSPPSIAVARYRPPVTSYKRNHYSHVNGRLYQYTPSTDFHRHKSCKAHSFLFRAGRATWGL